MNKIIWVLHLCFRALLGDEKAKLGISFLYDAPAGLDRKEVSLSVQ